MDHVTAGHPGVAAVSLAAAALGVLSGSFDVVHTGLFTVISPDDITAWTKAITGAVFTSVNTLVGCWNLVAIAAGHRRRRRAKKDANPAPAAKPPA